MDPISLLLAAANAVPAIAKFFNAGETTTKIAKQVGEIAGIVTGNQIPPEERMKMILASEQMKQEFQIRINDQMMKWDEMYLKDVQSARDRDVKLAQAGIKNTRANWLVVIAFTTLILCFAVVVWMSDLNEYTKGIITLILGRCLGWVEQIFSFEFGTTRSSKSKDDTIQKLSGGEK